jgi:hypothetical protein
MLTFLTALFCCLPGTIMCRPPVVKQRQRPVVAVAGDSNLDVTMLKSHRLQGDEQVKEQLAFEVRPVPMY